MDSTNFEIKSLSIIEERQEIITELERAIFTKRYSFSQKHLTILSSNSISILYSIWEGFIQQIFAIYIDEINEEHNELFSLCDSLIIFCKERKFKELKEYPTKANKKITMIRKMKEFYKSDVQIIPRNIDTESNVGFEVLNRLLSHFNIEAYPEHWQNYKHPNPTLKENLTFFLKIRNTISHGGELLPDEFIDQNKFIRFKKMINDLFYDIQDKMTENLKNGNYKSLIV